MQSNAKQCIGFWDFWIWGYLAGNQGDFGIFWAGRPGCRAMHKNNTLLHLLLKLQFYTMQDIFVYLKLGSGKTTNARNCKFKNKWDSQVRGHQGPERPSTNHPLLWSVVRTPIHPKGIHNWGKIETAQSRSKSRFWAIYKSRSWGLVSREKSRSWFSGCNYSPLKLT